MSYEPIYPRVRLAVPGPFISRSTVQRATLMPARFICNQTLSAPQTCQPGGVPDTLNISHEDAITFEGASAQIGVTLSLGMAPVNTTGPSASPCKWARTQSDPSNGQSRTSRLESVVEHRICKNSLAVLRMSLERRNSLPHCTRALLFSA
jgi:hypothetical protein